MNEDIERLEIACNKTRFTLLKSLSESDGYAARFANDLKIERKTIAFHLKCLEGVGLVEAKFKLNDRRAVKSYKITNQGKRIYNHIISLK